MTEPLAETFVVQLTPQGRGAVSVVLVAGPDAIRTVDPLFHSASGRGLADIADDQICYGHWASPTGEDVVVVRRSGLFSQGNAHQGNVYQGNAHQERTTSSVEVQCHGGSVAVSSIIADLQHTGCRALEWQDGLRLEEPDGFRFTARVALAAAPTLRTAKHLLDQYHGAFRSAVQAALDSIAANDLHGADDRLTELLSWAEFGQQLTKPWKVVLAGNTNVGKSSLINALVGYGRAIVSPQPGTTRDVVTATTAIDGWPVELADTAGIRDSSDDIERQGISRARATAARADLVIHVADIYSSATLPSLSDSRSPLDARSPLGNRELQVLNKIDLLDASSGQLPGAPIRTSATTGQGIAELVEAIGHALVPVVPPSGTAIPLTAEQSDLLCKALDACQRNDSPSTQQALQALLSNEA